VREAPGPRPLRSAPAAIAGANSSRNTAAATLPLSNSFHTSITIPTHPLH